MIKVLDERLKRMEDTVTRSANTVDRASEAIFTHIPKCEARDERHSQWFEKLEERDRQGKQVISEVSQKLTVLEIHKEYMQKAQNKNDKFNWALITGVATVIGLIVADFISKHLH